MRTWRRTATAVVALALGAGMVSLAPAARGATTLHADRSGCTTRTLVVSAMPVEIGPLLAKEKVSSTVHLGVHDFFVGTLRGHHVVLAMTGIGPVNATTTTQLAFKHFRCAGRSMIHSVVFSGVAGGDYIGDVLVPTRWTLDNGKHYYGVNARMLEVVRRVAHHHLGLERTNPIGDPLCACVTKPDAVKTVTVTHKPTVEVGGKGQTTDPFGGHAFPCVPGGGDVFGCEPCPEPKHLGTDLRAFLSEIGPLLSPSFVESNADPSSGESPGYVAEDNETAAVDKVAAAHHAPFIGFRAVSDGGGDPLHLPGYPAEFFVYRQLAADNAARTALAFLSAWR